MLYVITTVIRMLWSLLSYFMMKFFPSKPKDITGKVVLITGAAGGIGQQLAYKFALCGVKLALVDLNEDGLMETKKNLESKNVSCKTYKCDVSKRDLVAKLGIEVRRDFETVDILVNNAGVSHLKNFLRLKDEEIKQMIDVNLFGVIWLVKEFLPDMVARNEGHIVNICSIACVYMFPLGTIYSASKYGVNGFGEALVGDLERLEKTGVCVSTVYPNAVDTPMLQVDSDLELDLGGYELLKPEFVAMKIVEGILVEKRHIFIPDEAWILGVLKSLLPVKTMKVLTDSQTFGVYEKSN